jgi:hypothetical protein
MLWLATDRHARQSAQWLNDRIWTLITICWNEKREQRWDIRTVYNQLSASNTQEIAKTEQGNCCAYSTSDMGWGGYPPFADDQTRPPTLNVAGDALPNGLPAVLPNLPGEGDCSLSP